MLFKDNQMKPTCIFFERLVERAAHQWIGLKQLLSDQLFMLIRHIKGCQMFPEVLAELTRALPFSFTLRLYDGIKKVSLLAFTPFVLVTGATRMSEGRQPSAR